MPKKPSTVVVMAAYAALSSRRWIKLRVAEVARSGRENLQLSLSIEDEPSQAGRMILHEVPVVLAPRSPLMRFLEDGFGVRLTENQPFDLTMLVGRMVETRFSKALDGQAQVIVAVRAIAESTALVTDKSKSANAKAE